MGTVEVFGRLFDRLFETKCTLWHWYAMRYYAEVLD